MAVERRANSDGGRAGGWGVIPPAEPATHADERLDAALAWTSHELRGPLLAARAALDYSPPGTPVAVRVQGRGPTVRIGVRDRGPGVPLAERASVFEPFVRGRGTRRRGGTGLGLYIARRVVEAHGGEIWLESATGG